jgi:cyclopropane fatty-acyl-phospholipid synthase-like methyltransferase
MTKIKAGKAVRSVLKRAASPRHLHRAISLQRQRRKIKRSSNDPQLKLYAEILPGDFLHYGYFDDPDTPPQEISLNDIHRAQLRYAELLLEKITDTSSPILDVGCGMGGLIKLMLDAALQPVALTPNKDQIRYVKEKYPQVPAIEAKLEEISATEHSGRYGTVITAESLQYLDFDVALPLIEKLLKPGGRWIASDYFRIDGEKSRSEHWHSFEERVAKAGFRFVHQQDITPNVLPTMRYVHMWGNDIGRPVLNFCFGKLQTKQPGMHYLLQELIGDLTRNMDFYLDVVNPETFAARSKYMLLVMEKIHS